MTKPQPEIFYTLDEYFALEKGSERRWEYWDGQIFCMSGGSKEHAIIQGNVLKYLSNRLKKHCRAFSPDMAVKTKSPAGYVYPDVSAACNPKYEKHEQGIDILANPVMIIEVTSPTSAIRDHHIKKKAYQAIESLQDYLIIEPDSLYITHYIRGPKQWKKRVYDDDEDTIEISSVGVALKLTEIYDGVEFE